MSEAEQLQSPEERFFGVRTQVKQQSEVKDAEQSDLSIEVVDDRPSEDQHFPRASEAVNGDDKELEGYSTRVRKRIDKLRYAQHEERRQKEEAERMREEAVKVAQQLAGKNREYEELIQRGEGALITQVKERAKLSLDKATSSYRKAYEEGDTDKVVDAQGNLVRAQTELNEIEQYERNLPPQPNPNDIATQQALYQQQLAQWAAYNNSMQQPQRQQQQQQQLSKPDPQAVDWAERNPWFGNPKEKVMSATAYALHEEALQDHHMDASSGDYFQYIDTGMRKQFPDYSWSDDSGDGLPATATVKKASATSVVAPSARNNGSRSRKVRLSSTQVSLAKRLGLTNDQYAKQLVKERANG